MKKKTLFCTFAMAAMMLISCGTTGMFGTPGTNGGTIANSGDALGNILTSVLGGTSKPTLKQLIGTWKYSQPGCAFTSDQLLAQAGGEIVASQVKAKLQPTFQKLGVRSNNTFVTLNEDKTFAASFAGKSFSGTYTYNEATQQLSLQGMLLNINCYAKRNADGIALLFESSKLLTMLQTLSALSGNSSLQTVGEIAKSYDGMRIGFDFK
ncbi:MAG: DUF4923 family protein [Prevotella sp.]|nr:DUF4923 family protein [Prevotella sp.]